MRNLYFLLISLISFPAFTQPVASFDLSRQKVCSGKTVVFNNTSIGAGSYSWYVNNTFHSNNTHDSITLFEPCYDLVPVLLIASSTLGSDTLTKFIEVFDSCFLHLTGEYANCVGDTIRKMAHVESVANNWNIDPPHSLLAGCFTCDSVVFILTVLGTTVDLQSTYDGGCMQEVSYHYGACIPIVNTGIQEASAGNIKIYPNPFTDQLSIENGTGDKINSFSLYDTRGTLIKHETNVGKNIPRLGDIPPGLYFLRLELPREIVVTKILKQ